jgi:hypothetical protein
MRRTGLLQLGLLCFFLASDLTEWRWFETDPQIADGEISQIDVLPIAMRHRAQIVDSIEHPPTICCGGHPVLPPFVDARTSSMVVSSSGTFGGVPIVYSYMSLQL